MTEWAEKFRILSSKRSAIPGGFRAWAFQREPMDVCSPHDPTQFIVLMCAIQILKTTVIENMIGCFVQNDPCPMIVYQPREDDVQYFSKTGIDPMFSDCQSLKRLVVGKKSRDSGNTINEKQFLGGSLTILGSQTASNFQMRTARVVWVDEADRAPRVFPGEGALIQLAINRTANFRRIRKFGLASSPTVEGDSPIAEWYEKSDQRRYYVPCPFCLHMQVLVWSSVHAHEPTTGGVVWGKQPEGYIEPSEACYRCEACLRLIENWRKSWMLDRGEWRKGNTKSKIAGFHLSRLYSPITPWGDLAIDFIAALKDPGKLQTFINTQLAQVWRLQGEALEWRRLVERREIYSAGTVPSGGLVLAAGVDVQRADGGRLECEIVAFGENRETWSVDYRILYGDPSQPDVWNKLEKLLHETFPRDGGGEMEIQRMFVDSGDGTTTAPVYDWVQKQPRGRVFAIKGDNRAEQPVSGPKAVEIKRNGKANKYGPIFRIVGVDFFKGILYADLRQSAPTSEESAAGLQHPQGYCHFPLDTAYGDEHFKEICSEQLVTRRDRKGREITEYQQIRPNNHALDVRIYAMAAGWDLGVHRKKPSDWAHLRRQLESAAGKARAGTQDDTPVQFIAPRPVYSDDGGWV